MASSAGMSSASRETINAASQTISETVCARHGGREVYTSYTDTNLFRRFARCPERQVTGCKFFAWVDEEMPEHYRGCVRALKYQKEALESQLQYKDLTIRSLYEKLDRKDSKCDGTMSERPTSSSAIQAQAKSGKGYFVVGVLLATLLVGLCKYF